MDLLATEEAKLKEAGRGTYLWPVPFRHAFELLRDLLVRLRRPDGPFDATMLLVATWDGELNLGWIEDPADNLKMPTFFSDMLDAVMTNTPVDIHQELRRRRLGEEPPAASHRQRMRSCPKQPRYPTSSE